MAEMLSPAANWSLAVKYNLLVYFCLFIYIFNGATHFIQALEAQ